MFGHGTKFQLPFSSVTQEIKVAQQDKEVILYTHPADGKESLAGVEVHTQRKWHAWDAVGRAEARMWDSTLVGTMATGCAELSNNPKPCYSRAKGKERRRLIQEEVRAGRFSIPFRPVTHKGMARRQREDGGLST